MSPGDGTSAWDCGDLPGAETSGKSRVSGHLRLAVLALWVIPGHREGFFFTIQGGATTGSVCSREVLWCRRMVDLKQRLLQMDSVTLLGHGFFLRGRPDHGFWGGLWKDCGTLG